MNNAGFLVVHEKHCKQNPNRIQKIKSPNAGAQKGCVPWNKGKKIGKLKIWEDKYPNEKIFVENSTYRRAGIKERILKYKMFEYKCSICCSPPEWLGKPMVLILDHINGVNNDNRIENLRFVCSNCDSQLPTYKSKNRNGR